MQITVMLEQELEKLLCTKKGKWFNGTSLRRSRCCAYRVDKITRDWVESVETL